MHHGLYGVYFLADSNSYSQELPINYIVLSFRENKPNIAGAYYSQGRNFEPYYNLGSCSYLGSFSVNHPGIEISLKSKYSNNTFTLTGEFGGNPENDYRTIYFKQKLSLQLILNSHFTRRSRSAVYTQFSFRELNQWRDENAQKLIKSLDLKDGYSALSKSGSVSAFIDLLKHRAKVTHREEGLKASLLKEFRARDKPTVKPKNEKNNTESYKEVIDKTKKKNKNIDLDKGFKYFQILVLIGAIFKVIQYFIRL